MTPSEYKAVYDWMYANNPEYGKGTKTILLPEITDFLKGQDACRFVDMGCGRGLFLDSLHRCLPNASLWGVDISRVEPTPRHMTFIQSALWEVKPIIQRVDGLSCFDVLEHLTEEDIDKSLSCFVDLLNPYGKAWIAVSTKPAQCTPPPGVENLHLTIKDEGWWLTKFCNFFPVVNFNGFIFRISV